MRRSIIVTIIVILAAIMLQPAAVMARNDRDVIATKDVRKLIQQFGPLVYFHPDEEYLLDMPEAVLSGGTELVWGAVAIQSNPLTGDLMFVNVVEHGRVMTSADGLLNDVAMATPVAGDVFWLDTPADLRSGHLQRAKVYVVVSQPEDGFLDLDFWFFYPYNGALKARVNALGNALVSLDPVGRHSGDWEHVIVRLADTSGTWTLQAVYLSEHSGGTWVPASALTLDGSRPIVYAAKDSHAFYPAAGEYTFRTLTLGALVVRFNDVVAGGGASFDAAQPGNYRISWSDVPGLTVPSARDWLFYEGRWGPYEQQVFVSPYPTVPLTYPYVGSGPVGPLQH